MKSQPETKVCSSLLSLLQILRQNLEVDFVQNRRAACFSSSKSTNVDESVCVWMTNLKENNIEGGATTKNQGEGKSRETKE